VEEFAQALNSKSKSDKDEHVPVVVNNTNTTTTTGRTCQEIARSGVAGQFWDGGKKRYMDFHANQLRKLPYPDESHLFFNHMYYAASTIPLRKTSHSTILKRTSKSLLRKTIEEEFGLKY
jgi:hypothetical protein